MATETATTTTTGLRRNAIGLREVTFQSITDMAPGAAIAASIPAGVAFAGGALPLAVVFALVACLLCAVSIGLLAREMPSAGSVATYAARGLHPAIGFLVAWGYVLVGFLIPPLVLLQLGFTTAATLNAEFHGYPANLWWPWALLGAVIVLAAGFYGIRTSARLGTALGVFEIGVFVVLAVFFIVHAGSSNTLSVFTTKYTPIALPRPHRGDRRLGVHDPGVRRVRGRRPAGRGGQEPAPDHPARDPAGHPGHRPAVRVHHLRGGRRVRARAVPQLHHRHRGRVLGGHGPLAVRRLLVLRVPGHRQLHHRQRERRA